MMEKVLFCTFFLAQYSRISGSYAHTIPKVCNILTYFYNVFVLPRQSTDWRNFRFASSSSSSSFASAETSCTSECHTSWLLIVVFRSSLAKPVSLDIVAGNDSFLDFTGRCHVLHMRKCDTASPTSPQTIVSGLGECYSDERQLLVKLFQGGMTRSVDILDTSQEVRVGSFHQACVGTRIFDENFCPLSPVAIVVVT